MSLRYTKQSLLRASPYIRIKLGQCPAAWFCSPCSVRHATSAANTSNEPEPLIRVRNLPAPGSGHIRLLELNRPKARNAISRALLSSLREQIESVHGQYDPDTGAELDREGKTEADGATRALILASAVDESFCAGADLKERKGFTSEETSQFLHDLRAALTRLSTLPVPTISAVSSVALGGGFELALATHFRVLATTATVGLPETRLGIIPGAGGTYRAVQRLGRSRALDLILTGRRVRGWDALHLDLADYVVQPEGETEEQWQAWEASGWEPVTAEMLAAARLTATARAVELAEEICAGGPIAVRAALRAVTHPQPSEAVENAMYERVVGTEDRNEALKAFAEKRKPVFTGR